MTRATLISLAAGALLLASAGLSGAAWAGHGHGHGNGHGHGHGHARGHGPTRVLRERGHRRGHHAPPPARHGPRHGHYRGPVVVIPAPPPPRAARYHRHGRSCGHRVVAAPRHYAPRVALGVHYDGFYFRWEGGY